MDTNDWQINNPFFIKNVKIENLINKKNISWDLFDVNVLVGRNGSGKSTIVRLINAALTNSPETTDNIESNLARLSNKFDSIEITLNNDQKCLLSNIKDKSMFLNSIIQTIKIDMEKHSISFDETIEKNIKENLFKNIDRNIANAGFFSAKSSFIKRNDNEVINMMLDAVNIEFVSTFDTLILSKEEYSQYENKNYSHLDIEIERQITKLKGLMLSLSNDMTSEYISQNIKASIDEVFTQKRKKDLKTIHSNHFKSINIFEKELNKVFNQEDKQFKINKDGSLVVKASGQSISIFQLSSGEKQYLYILLKAINSIQKPTIFIMDEPEISLHLTWQENLISSIQRINSNSQIILVSHSPAVVMQGWMNKLIDIKKLEV